MKPIVLSVAIVGALALAPPALAVKTIAPPGNSSAGEYLETVPTSNGNRRSDSFPGGSGGGGGHRGGPSASTVHRLGGLGTAAYFMFSEDGLDTRDYSSSGTRGGDLANRLVDGRVGGGERSQ